MKRLIFTLLLTIMLSSDAYAIQLKCGSYSGNGSDDREVTGVGFQPSFVLIKIVGSNYGVLSTTSMGVGYSELFSSGGLATNLVQAFSADGFQVGTAAQVNSNGVTYSYCAGVEDGVNFSVGTYTGNGGATQTVSGVGFTPTGCLVRRGDTSYADGIWSSSDMAGYSLYFTGGGGAFSTGIKALISDGFQVGSSNFSGASGVAYYYVCWVDYAGAIDTGTYAGNGVDNRSITGVGFLPDWVAVGATSQYEYQHLTATTATTDACYQFGTLNGSYTNKIQKRNSDGFEVGTDAATNADTVNYYYLAFKSKNYIPPVGHVIGGATLGGFSAN
jgi:hypothetical protein